MKKWLVVMAALLTLSALPVTVHAGIEPSPFSLPETGGFDNPIFWGMFNPQPEPPGSWMQVNALDPYVPFFTVPNDAGGSFRLAFDIRTATVPLTVQTAATEHELAFSIFRPGSFTPLELAYTARFTFASNGTGLNGSDVMFNPQPEPPGLPYGALFSLRFGGAGMPDLPIPAGSEVTMALRMTDNLGQPIAMNPVPEPATFLLLGLGLVGVIGARKKFRK